MRTLGLPIIGIFAITFQISATTIHVPADTPTIQEAINLANVGDTILVADGVYSGEGNRDIDFLGKDIIVRSASGDPTRCIIDCQGSLAEPHRGFIFQSEESNAAHLSGFTIMNAYTEEDDPWPQGGWGGGIHCWFASPTLENLILRDNLSLFGAGIAVMGFSSTISNCRFYNNDASIGFDAGGLTVYSSHANVSDCLFIGNMANYGGGGLSSYYSVLTVERCEFFDNWCRNHGGAIATSTDSVWYSYCTIARNQARTRSGGIHISANEYTEIDHCTIVDNEAVIAGGGIYKYFPDEEVYISNSIIAENRPDPVYCSDFETGYIITCTDIYGNENGDWVDCLEALFGVSGNISEDPLFCGEANPLSPFSLHELSPCNPDNYPCLLIGAQPVGCSLADVDEFGEMELERSICEIHPNPTGNSSVLRFTLTEPKPVSVRIVDVAGRLVNRLLDERIKAAGQHEVSWNGADASGRLQPSGVYFYQVEYGSNSEIKRIVLVND